MTGKNLVDNALTRQNKGPNPFWLGCPVNETKELYARALGITGDSACESGGVHEPPTGGMLEIALAIATGSDVVWLCPEFDADAYRTPDNKPLWDHHRGVKPKSLSQPGVFAGVDSIKEIEAFDWPNPENISFDRNFREAEKARDSGLAVFGGMWCPFFHVLCGFFGMENYFERMYTDPDIVIAATEHVVDFYLAANKRCLDATHGLLSAAFFGNDLGTQRALLISPECIGKFILPYMQKIIDQIKGYSLNVMLHCCGAVSEIIPMFIEAGIDALHPIQALAAGMEPERLQRAFGADLVFMGGVDTQLLLPFGTVEEVEQKVERLRDIFGPNFIVSPSHEALLPNVGVEKVMAMSRKAKE